MNKRIVYQKPDGGVAVVVTAPDCGLTVEEIAAKDVPAGLEYQIVDVADVPADRTFRAAWVKGDGRVDIDLGKAKDVAHDVRREKREQEFAPLDDAIAKQLPGRDMAEVEFERQGVRDKYATIQTEIDEATDVAGLKSVVDRMRGA